MLKLKLQYFGHLMEELTPWKRPWCWETLKGGEGDNRGCDGWMASPTWWTWVWASSGSWWLTGSLAWWSPWDHKELVTTEQLNWTDKYYRNTRKKATGNYHPYRGAQLYLTLCDCMGCSPPGSSVHGILQARILEWVAISFSWWSSQPGDWTGISWV